MLRYFLNRYVYQDWNIAIADIASDLTPTHIQWMKHSYRDRWFADPFIIGETEEAYIILVEECMHNVQKGRLARLTVSKADCCLVKNETLLDLTTHLSYPITIEVDGKVYMYPENGQSGKTSLYTYGSQLTLSGVLSDLPLADATIFKHDEFYYMLFTMGEQCNGNVLQVYRSTHPLRDFVPFQELVFEENIARRAGNIFYWNNKLISPAQVCNTDYGEGVSYQELTFENGRLSLQEIKRLYPPTKEYPEGFHTFNVFGNKVVIDGYRYGSKLLHDLYFKIRG